MHPATTCSTCDLVAWTTSNLPRPRPEYSCPGRSRTVELRVGWCCMRMRNLDVTTVAPLCKDFFFLSIKLFPCTCETHFTLFIPRSPWHWSLVLSGCFQVLKGEKGSEPLRARLLHFHTEKSQPLTACSVITNNDTTKVNAMGNTIENQCTNKKDNDINHKILFSNIILSNPSGGG